MSHLNKAAARWLAFGLPTVLILMLAGGPAYAHQKSAVAAAQGGWTATGSMAVSRRSPTATLLPDGKVLVVGGSNELVVSGAYLGRQSLASAELYDPASHTWSTTGSMHQARVYHTATLLPNGKVLVAGGKLIIPGRPEDVNLANSELYDPATGTWSMTGRMNHARSTFTATLLPNGYVLAAGGDESEKTAEIYHPDTGLWARTNSMPVAQYAPTATLLPTGKVLIAGEGSVLYNPVDYTWWRTGALRTLRYDATATLVRTGKVLLVGGFGVYGAPPQAKAELYDNTTHSWTAASDRPHAGGAATATLLKDGTVLLVGGDNTEGNPTRGDISAADRYNPSTGAWTSAGSMTTARFAHTATLMGDGSVLVTGGDAGQQGGHIALSSAELFTPS